MSTVSPALAGTALAASNQTSFSSGSKAVKRSKFVRVTIINGRRSGSYRSGTTISIFASAPRLGMKFERWEGPVGDPASPTTTLLVPTTAVTARAIFVSADTAVRPVQVTVAGGAGSGVYKPGSTVTISADAAPDGRNFARWTGDVGSLADPNSPVTRLTVPNEPVNLAATYADMPAAADVEVSVAGGTGSGRYKPGAVVTLYAYAAPGGQAFDRWVGPGVASPTEPITAFTVPSQAATIQATYKAGAAADVTLTVRGGSGSGRYKPGTTVRLAAAAPPAGKVFAGWIGDVAALAEPTLPETDYRVGASDATVEASFGDPGFVLTSHKNGDTISVNGETVFGKVADLSTLDRVAVQVGDDQRVVGVDKDGNFAFRVFREFITPGQPVDAVVTLYSTTSEAKSATLRFATAQKDGAVQQILGRLTFGATPALLNDIEARRKADPTGWYRTWVEEQLGINGKSATENSFITTLNPKKTYIDDGLGARTPTQYTKRFDGMANAVALRMMPAAYSSLQLREVMAQFWDNHFHTSDQDGRARYSKTVDFQNYRENALGTFRDLLNLSATSGPMMWFLTNFVNTKGAINENYGREIMELHTVGVDGGYTQDDVVAVAKLLTGRGMARVCFSATTVVTCFTPQSAYEKTNFVYTSAQHVTEDVTVPFLQKTYKNSPSTMADSNALIDDLANHPSTKRFICKKIVEYLVSDEKPVYFIDKCVDAWGTNGDIKSMLAAILLDPSYITNADLQRTKFKTPYEYAVGMLRNFSIDPDKYNNKYTVANDAKYTILATDIKSIWENADMNFFDLAVPTGFDEQASSVLMTSTMIARIDAATAFLRGGNQLTNRFAPLATTSRNVTAEAAAAYLLKLGTGDRYSRLEFEAVRNALQGSDGVFDPDAKTGTDSNEEVSVRKAVGLILTLPSYQFQ